MEGLSCFSGGFCDVEQTNAAITKMLKEENYLIDTHTAVAYKVYEDYRNETGDDTPTMIASTASAYKFADSVLEALGLEKAENGFKAVEKLAELTGVAVPKGLAGLEDAPVLHDEVIDKEGMADSVRRSV